MTVRNPLSPRALTQDDVAPGRGFLCYVPFDDNSLHWGVFMSEVHRLPSGEDLVDIMVDGSPKVRTVGLISMGILPADREQGIWARYLTIPRS
jgi:hypothetical protein